MLQVASNLCGLARWFLASFITALCLIPSAWMLLQAGAELLVHSLARQVAGFAARELWDRQASAARSGAVGRAMVTLAVAAAAKSATASALAWEGTDGQTLGTVWTWS